ncbi:MAG: hypothetical protein CL534_23530 [Ahrensia sp.]|nr:hypothetical protein [Ahrensia sp.]
MSKPSEPNVDDLRVPRRVTIELGAAVVPVDDVSLDYAVSWTVYKHRDDWEVLVTPNLHHLRVVRGAPSAAEPYSAAGLSLADGWPVAWLASRVAGRRVDRVIGAELFQKVIEQTVTKKPLVLIGGTPSPGLEALFHRCRNRGWSVSSEPAPRSELVDPTSRAALVSRVARAGSGGIVVIGVGAPLQESIACEIAKMPGSGAILCLGMSINFSSGVARRAPRIVQSFRLEWAYRALQEPRRLFKRYAQDLLALPHFIRANPRPPRK